MPAWTYRYASREEELNVYFSSAIESVAPVWTNLPDGVRGLLIPSCSPPSPPRYLRPPADPIKQV